MTTITPATLKHTAGTWYIKGYANYGLTTFAIVLCFMETPAWIPWAIVATLAFINARKFMQYGDDLLLVAAQMENGNVKIASRSTEE